MSRMSRAERREDAAVPPAAGPTATAEDGALAANAVERMRRSAREAVRRAEPDPRPTQPPSVIDAPPIEPPPPLLAQWVSLWLGLWLWPLRAAGAPPRLP